LLIVLNFYRCTDKY